MISVGQAQAGIEKRVHNSKRLAWLREIRHYQRTVDPIIPRLNFQRLVKEISQDYKIASNWIVIFDIHPHINVFRSLAVKSPRRFTMCR